MVFFEIIDTYCFCLSTFVDIVFISFRAFVYSLLINNGKPMPFVHFILAFIFCGVNGCAQTRTLGHLTTYPESSLLSYHFVPGVILFFIGMAVNIHSDYVLRNLRKPGETGYKIPKGRLGSEYCYLQCLMLGACYNHHSLLN